MPAIAVQALPDYAQGLAGVTFVACDVGGDTFLNDGNVVVIVRAGATWTNETAQVEGVPAPNSGRDGVATLDPQAVNGIDMAGKFPTANWNTSAGAVAVTYPGGITGLDIAIVRVV